MAVVLYLLYCSTVDWMVADFLASRQGSLGSIRYILKDGLKFMPLYGYYFRQVSGEFTLNVSSFFLITGLATYLF